MDATFDGHVWWYLARASGLVAWALLVASVLWGLAVAGRFTRKAPSPAWVLDLHRALGGLAVIFTAVHVGGLVADSYVHFGWAEVLVPFASPWKPVAVAAGVIGFWILLAVELTSLLQRRLPRRWWRRIHTMSFALAVLATGHFLTAGTDAGSSGARVALAASLGLVTGALLVRAVLPGLRKARREAARPARAPVPSGS